MIRIPNRRDPYTGDCRRHTVAGAIIPESKRVGKLRALLLGLINAQIRRGPGARGHFPVNEMGS